MASYKEIEEEIETVSIIRIITDIYERIAFLKIHQQTETISSIRRLTQVYEKAVTEKVTEFKELVLGLRSFFGGVAKTYSTLKSASVTPIQNAASVIKGKNVIGLKQRTVLVFLSANKSLYGELIFDVFKDFLRDAKASGADVVVIGRIGRLLNEAEKLPNKTVYFDLDDDNPNWDQVKKITDHILNYEVILVYYGQYQSVFLQKPATSDITGEPKFEKTSDNQPRKKYIFEPSPTEIYNFFRQEITATQFRQRIYESQLARYAARMIAMDEATQQADRILNELERKYWRYQRKKNNQKQLASIYRYQSSLS